MAGPPVHLLGERRPIGPDYGERSASGIHPGGDPTSGFDRSRQSRPAEIHLHLTRRQLALAPMCANVLANNHVHNPKHLAAQAQTGGHTMTTHVRCGSLFTGDTSAVRNNATLGFGEDGKITFVCDTADAPPVSVHDSVWIIRVVRDAWAARRAYASRVRQRQERGRHRPLSAYGVPRPARLFFAQKVVAAGYTSICAPGDAGQISLSVRNAINFGLFDGPRVTAAGRYLTTGRG